MFKLNLDSNLFLTQLDSVKSSIEINNHSLESESNVIWNDYFSEDKFISKISRLGNKFQKSINDLILSNHSAFYKCPISLSKILTSLKNLTAVLFKIKRRLKDNVLIFLNI